MAIPHGSCIDITELVIIRYNDVLGHGKNNRLTDEGTAKLLEKYNEVFPRLKEGDSRRAVIQEADVRRQEFAVFYFSASGPGGRIVARGGDQSPPSTRPRR